MSDITVIFILTGLLTAVGISIRIAQVQRRKVVFISEDGAHYHLENNIKGTVTVTYYMGKQQCTFLVLNLDDLAEHLKNSGGTCVFQHCSYIELPNPKSNKTTSDWS